LDIPEGVPCTIANPRAETEGQIGIVRITRRTTRQNYVNTCSSFQLIAAAQRDKAMKAVILIRNDSRLNNEYESGNFLEGTTYAIFAEQQSFDGIIEQFGGAENIMQMSASILVAPGDGMKISLHINDS
jgi:predicted peptidase